MGGVTDPRYRPAPQPRLVRRPAPPRPTSSARAEAIARRRAHLESFPICQWQSRMVRCCARATNVVESREGVLRSTCEECWPKWLRTGGRQVIF